MRIHRVNGVEVRAWCGPSLSWPYVQQRNKSTVISIWQLNAIVLDTASLLIGSGTTQLVRLTTITRSRYWSLLIK